MDNHIPQLVTYLAKQAVVRRPVVQSANPGLRNRMLTVMIKAAAPEITPAGSPESPPESSSWANRADSAFGDWSPALRHGAIGAGVGGLGTLMVSKLMGRKWKDALWDSLLGAGVGGLAGAGSKLLSQTMQNSAPNQLGASPLATGGKRVLIKLKNGPQTWATVDKNNRLILDKYALGIPEDLRNNFKIIETEPGLSHVTGASPEYMIPMLENAGDWGMVGGAGGLLGTDRTLICTSNTTCGWAGRRGWDRSAEQTMTEYDEFLL